jgi:serine/threonine-protein kinase
VAADEDDRMPTGAPPPASPSPGDVLAGKYRIEGLVGRGGMGAVFAATDLVLGRRVAVKTLLAEGLDRPGALPRFFNEARAAAQIDSEHVVRVLDVGAAEGGLPFIVLEYLEGVDLAHLARERRLDPVEAVDYVLQALDALAQAHARGIIHRDLKPANLFLVRRADGAGGRGHIKVLDFGISKITAAPFAQAGITASTAILGSPAYMSPEQLRSAKGVDARSDVWSVGVILYELLAGCTPFAAEEIGAIFAAILERTPAPVRSHQPGVAPGLDAVVMRCLARDPSQRFQSVSALATALAPFASPAAAAAAAPILATLDTASWVPATTPPARRARTPFFAVGIVAAIAALGASLLLVRPHPAPSAPSAPSALSAPSAAATPSVPATPSASLAPLPAPVAPSADSVPEVLDASPSASAAPPPRPVRPRTAPSSRPGYSPLLDTRR